MLRRLRGKWQAWLDGTTRPVFEETEPSEAPGPDFFGDREVTWTPVKVETMTRDQYVARQRGSVALALRELSTRVDLAQELEALTGEPAAVKTAERPYTAELGPLATELLDDLDRTFQALLAENRNKRTWRSAMVERRSTRNQHAAAVDVEHLWRDEEDPDVADVIVPTLVSAMVSRALHASDEGAPTGLIPVTSSAVVMEEDPDS